MRRKVVVRDLMQQGYIYYCTEPVGGHFASTFRPELTPKQMLRLGVFGGKYMTDCRVAIELRREVDERISRELVRRREAVRRASRSSSELLRRQCVTIARGLAAERLDSSAGSTRVVSMVLPVLHGSPDRGRRAADPAVACDRAPRRGNSEELRDARSRLPPQTAPGCAALGLR
jgi:hypothetical protein